MFVTHLAVVGGGRARSQRWTWLD